MAGPWATTQLQRSSMASSDQTVPSTSMPDEKPASSVAARVDQQQPGISGVPQPRVHQKRDAWGGKVRRAAVMLSSLRSRVRT